MFFRSISYLKFLLKSRNQHGVHSPFVYNLITKCFYKKLNNKCLNKLIEVRTNLSSNSSLITVSDFGAGSKIFTSNKRQVSKIVKHVSISRKRARLLFNVVHYFNPKSILEIGTSVGLSTSALSLAAPTSKITSIEGCTQTAKVARNIFNEFKFQNIELLIGEFETKLPNLLLNNTYDFIYFDGNHTKKATIDYFNSALSSIHNDSVFIFDDIHWSKEMEEAWSEIKSNPKVTITIDTFQWGFVFFRKEQQKEHFIIRV